MRFMEKYGYSITFLEKDSELRSYFLGYFIADGWLDKTNRQLHISSSEKQIIDALVAATQYTNKVVTQQNQSVWNVAGRARRSAGPRRLTGTTQYTISFSGPPANTVWSLGFDERKTTREFIPAGVSIKTFNHFVRGFFDGDGSISFVEHDGHKYMESSFYAGGTALLQLLLHTLRIQAIVSAERAHVYTRDSRSSFHLGHVDTARLCRYMYKNANIFNERKRNVYLIGSAQNNIRCTWTKKDISQLFLGQKPSGRSVSSCNMKLWRLRQQGITTPSYFEF